MIEGYPGLISLLSGKPFAALWVTSLKQPEARRNTVQKQRWGCLLW